MSRRRASSSVMRNLVIVSDLHAGCRLGIYNPDAPIRLDDGGFYRPSEFQEQMWSTWQHFWREWVPEATKGEPFDLLVNGDVVDGSHHGSVTQISQNILDQKRIAIAVLEPLIKAVKARGGTYYHVRGTEAHVGKSAEFEEGIAEVLGAKPNGQHQYARYDIWKRVGGPDGVLVHALHHIGTTGSAAYESSALMGEFTAMLVEAARWNREPPDFVVRSHRHRSIAVDVDTARGPGAVMTTPAWQGKGPFAWRVPGARLSEPQFGGVMIRCAKDLGEMQYYRRRVYSFDRSPEE